MNKTMIAVLVSTPLLLAAGCTVIETNTPGYNPYACSTDCNTNYICSSGCNTNYTCGSGCNTNVVYTPNYNCGSSYTNNCNYNNVGYASGYWGSPRRGCCSH